MITLKASFPLSCAKMELLKIQFYSASKTIEIPCSMFYSEHLYQKPISRTETNQVCRIVANTILILFIFQTVNPQRCCGCINFVSNVPNNWLWYQSWYFGIDVLLDAVRLCDNCKPRSGFRGAIVNSRYWRRSLVRVGIPTETHRPLRPPATTVLQTRSVTGRSLGT